MIKYTLIALAFSLPAMVSASTEEQPLQLASSVSGMGSRQPGPAQLQETKGPKGAKPGQKTELKQKAGPKAKTTKVESLTVKQSMKNRKANKNLTAPPEPDRLK